jgi:hypothetical protein
LPERVQPGDLVLRLSEGVSEAGAAATLRDHVVTPDLARSFDTALGAITTCGPVGSSSACSRAWRRRWVAYTAEDRPAVAAGRAADRPLQPVVGPLEVAHVVCRAGLPASKSCPGGSSSTRSRGA